MEIHHGSCALTRVDAATWRIELHDAMHVPAVIYADEDLVRGMDDKVYDLAANVAIPPGIVQAACAMPDVHWGYGFPIDVSPRSTGTKVASFRLAASDSIFLAAFARC